MSSCNSEIVSRQHGTGRPIPPGGGTGEGALQAHFLSILPRIERHARIYFRGVRCPGKREDAVAETVAISWQWFLRMAQRGKDAREFPSALASYAARAVKYGQRVCGQEKSKEVLSPSAQYRRGFCIETLPDVNTSEDNPFTEALADNMQSPVPEQVCFRMDFPAWLLTRTDRDRRMIPDMMIGERTETLADRFGMSPSRVSQLRSEYHADWQRFTDEAQ
jgi:hypothetical protein